MNFSAYDSVNNKSNTWVNPTYKRLYSRDIEYHLYYTFLKRYDTKSKSYTYYLALFNTPNSNVECNTVTKTQDNTIKIDLHDIWNDTSLASMTKRTNVNIRVIDEQDDGIVYELDI